MFAKQIASIATESRTNFQVSPAAVATVKATAKRRNVPYNALVTPSSRIIGSLRKPRRQGQWERH